MKTRNGKLQLRVLVLAVQAVLVAMYTIPAHADEEQIATLKIPTNFAEFGVQYVSKDSAKFGEYSGLNKSGGYLNGNFDIRGGDAYGDTNGTKRWELQGSDLGLTSRSAGASLSDQGKWSLGINYDQLTHYTSDSYQTPYLGTMGGNVFTLPTFGLAANARLLSGAQSASFQTMDISNNRDNTSLTGSYIIDRQWNIKLDFNHLDQSGAKLMGFGSSNVGGAGTEKVSILPMPTNSRTETANFAVNWLGDKGHATAAYYGSFYHDNYDSVKFQTWNGAVATQTMGTPPSNDFHQFNLTGGYGFSDRTKLAGGLSYSHNSQNVNYSYDNITPTVMVTPSPTNSLNGSIVNTHADVKLTDQTTKNLILSAGLKYDNRDNRTSSNIYNFNAISGGNTANYPNTPLSIKKWQAELAGDYRVDSKQKIRLALSHDDTERKCNQFAVGGGTPAYAPGTNCVIAPDTKEDKATATYRIKASDDVNFNVAYAYSDRRTDFDQNARASMIGLDGNAIVAPAISGVPAGITGINAGEFRGFNPFFELNRKQNMLKSGVNWQANEKLAFVLSGRYTGDNYDSTYGMQKGHSWGLNLDSTYNYREDGLITLYLTQQDRMREMTNIQRSPTTTPAAASATAVAIPSGATWTNQMKDTDTTIGLNVRQGGLMAGKLDVAGDVIYSLGRTSYNTGLNYNTTTTGGLTCADPTIFTCVALPDIKNAMLQFKLNGNYKLDKNSKLAFGYLYRRLHVDDFYYNGMQNGLTPQSVLPTNQTPPSYNINMVFASYIYTFK
jgi:MtrB/PioB family decaheme-associated outer membrane protein